MASSSPRTAALRETDYRFSQMAESLATAHSAAAPSEQAQLSITESSAQNGIPDIFSGRNDIDRHDSSDDKSWMASFCVEPPGDADTCGWGFFIPCALYGKVVWRFSRVALHQDATNKSWKSRTGCNKSCLIWLVLPYPLSGKSN